MGEKLRTLSKINLFGVEIEVELNKANRVGGLRDIHIQTPQFRVDMDEREYLKLASSVLWAKQHLRYLKGLDS